jgi:hypothetical protein
MWYRLTYQVKSPGFNFQYTHTHTHTHTHTLQISHESEPHREIPAKFVMQIKYKEKELAERVVDYLTKLSSYSLLICCLYL